MTSKQLGVRINSYNALSGSERLTNRALPLWEIALQLAVMNERENEKVESFSLAGPPVSTWPKIEQLGPRWALWMSPLHSPQMFDTEELAREHVRKIAQKMNEYVPPKKPSEGLDKTEVGKGGPVGERGGERSDVDPDWKTITFQSADGQRVHMPVQQIRRLWDENEKRKMQDLKLQSQGSRIPEPSPEASSAVPQKDPIGHLYQAYTDLLEAAKEICATGKPTVRLIGAVRNITHPGQY